MKGRIVGCQTGAPRAGDWTAQGVAKDSSDELATTV